MHNTQNDMPKDARAKVIDLLNTHLAALTDLSAQAKQAHWNVKGMQFIALHELFDKVHLAVTAFVDEVAERAVELGGSANGTVQAAVKGSPLKPYPLEIVSGPDHVRALSAVLAAYGKLARESIDAAGKLGDADTADLFTEISRVIDKQLWLVEAHQQG